MKIAVTRAGGLGHGLRWYEPTARNREGFKRYAAWIARGGEEGETQ